MARDSGSSFTSGGWPGIVPGGTVLWLALVLGAGCSALSIPAWAQAGSDALPGGLQPGQEAGDIEQRFNRLCQWLAQHDDPRVWLQAPSGNRCRAAMELGRTAELAERFATVDGAHFETLLAAWERRWRRVRDSYLVPVGNDVPAMAPTQALVPARGWLRAADDRQIAYLAVGDVGVVGNAPALQAYLAPIGQARMLVVDLREATGRSTSALATMQHWLAGYAGQLVVLLPSALYGPPEALAHTLVTRFDAVSIGQASRGLPGETRTVDLGAGWSMDVPTTARSAPLQPRYPARGFSVDAIEAGVDEMIDTVLVHAGTLMRQNKRQPLELRRPVR